MRWLQVSFARKLFASYLLVIVAGGATLLAAKIIEEMHEHGVVMGYPLAHTAASAALLEAAFRESPWPLDLASLH